jgi:hypothetical protein
VSRQDVSSGGLTAAPPLGGADTRDVLGVLALCALKAAVGYWVLAHGFTHISDDDYARTVIAEQFAHSPRLDPSATSWLPLPFWLEGGAMGTVGRSLGVARAVAMALGVASIAAPYGAMRLSGCSRAVAALAAFVTMVLPWNVWLGVATVPEGWTGALVAAAAIAMGNERAAPWAVGALMAASLARYEAWPACALAASHHSWRAVMVCRTLERSQRADTNRKGVGSRREVLYALVAAAGPLAWMAWNAHAHGSPVHFLARVSAFRQAIGAADMPLRDKLLGYPRAFVQETPEAAVLGMAGAAGLAASSILRARWKWAAAVAVATIAFLVVGDVRDGAPTHHAARALAAMWWIAIGMGVDAIFVFGNALAPARRLAACIAAGVVVLVWCAWLPSRWDASPGRSAYERRDAQIARGLDLRARKVAHASITPCSFEHFALLAAWGEPEKAEVRMRTKEPPTEDCPRVMEW